MGKESTEQVQRKQMLVPEFYLRGWGERRAGSGGMFGDPQGPLWCKLGGAGDTEAGAGAKRGGGCWVALRDLGSKLGSPSTLGSLASNCKANLFGAGRGRGSPVGGEVTGIRCGRPGLLKPGIGQLPLPALVSTLPWSTEGRAFTPVPLHPGPGTRRPRAGGGEPTQP